jgi:hypothetical protein
MHITMPIIFFEITKTLSPESTFFARPVYSLSGILRQAKGKYGKREDSKQGSKDHRLSRAILASKNFTARLNWFP